MTSITKTSVANLFDDVLVYIFRWGLALARNETEDWRPPRISPAWLYASICPRWRLLATEDSALWTFIEVDLSRPSHRDALVQAYASLMLKRSKIQPLTICITATGILPRYKTLSVLQQAQHRWRELIVDCPLPSLMASLAAPDNVDLWRSLHSFDLDFNWEHPPGMVLDLRDLPTLEVFSERTATTVRCDVYLPWDTLKHFHLEIRHPSHYVATVVEFGPRLEGCTILVSNWHDGPTRIVCPRREGIFPNLKRLWLKNASDILRLFKGARLEDVDIHGHFQKNRTQLPNLVSIFESSQDSIHTLFLQGWTGAMWDSSVSASIASMVNLRQFTVITRIPPLVITPTEPWLEKLAGFLRYFVRVGDIQPCPSLERLVCGWVIHETLDHPIANQLGDWGTVRSLWSEIWETHPNPITSELMIAVGEEQFIFTCPPKHDTDNESSGSDGA